MPEITEQEMKQFEALKQGLHLKVLKTGDHWAARLSGLTAYGKTSEEAIQKLKDMFTFKVDATWNRLKLEPTQ